MYHFAQNKYYVGCPNILITSIICRLSCVEMLVLYSRSEVYLSTGDLLYNVIAVYIINVLIKTSLKFEYHYNLLALSCYLDHFFSASFKI